jgi:nitrous oxide reductase
MNEYEKKHKVKKFFNQGISNYNPHFITFIEVCLSNKENLKIENVIDLINNKFENIDATKVLELLPTNLPIKNLDAFLTQSIQTTHHNLKNSKIKQKVAETANIETKYKYHTKISQKVVINQQTLCSHCQQPISTSVFAITPDLNIIHYKCLKGKNVKK